MLNDKITRIICSFCLTVLFFIPINSWAGSSFIDLTDNTDAGSSRIVAYWDTRGRSSSFQIANITGSAVNVNVQLFDAGGGQCAEIDFNDSLTAFDTHTYNPQNLVANSGADQVDVPSNSHGFAVISVSSGPLDSLIGVVRIIDGQGYDYRANAAGEVAPGLFTSDSVINFNLANGNAFSDLIGITYVELNADTVYASPGVSAIFGQSSINEILIYNDQENDTSWGITSFSCSNGSLNKGIDQGLPNSKGAGNVAPTNILNSSDSGLLLMPFDQFECTDQIVGDGSNVCQFPPHFVGFIGLNNGNGTGSFDSWWSTTDLVN